MKIGLDLDGTIDEQPWFFERLCTLRSADLQVFIITFRLDALHAKEYAASLGIHVDDVYLAKSHADKARVIRELDIDVFFEDSDEAIENIPKDVFVVKVRHADNFDFDERRWQ